MHLTKTLPLRPFSLAGNVVKWPLSVGLQKSGLMKKIRVPKNLDNITTDDPNTETDFRAAGISDKAVDTIWAHVEDMYRSGMHPAISLCIRRRGKVILNRAIGHARGNGPGDAPGVAKVLATPDTPFCWFSASKSVTAMCIHLLAQQQKIHLLDPVSHYIPKFAAHGKKDVTIQQVLVHRSGFATIPEEDADPDILFDFEQAVDMVSHLKHNSPRGRKVAYHAVTGGFILGEIVRRVTGRDINEFITKHISEPMDMPGFRYGVAKENKDRVALNYFTGLPVVFPASRVAKRALCVNWEEVVEISNGDNFMDTIVPSANLYSTAEELCRFYQMLLNQGRYKDRQIFDPITIRRAVMETGSRKLDSILLLPIPYSPGMILGGDPVGLFGLFSAQAFGHSGFINCMCWADPSREISVALANSGKPLLGPHLAPMVKLVGSISWNCPADTR